MGKKKRVVKIESSERIDEDLERLFKKIGGIDEYIGKSDKVLIKPSCNSWDDFPAVTSIDVIKKVVEIVKRQTNDVTIGDSSGVLYKPTDNVFKYMGLDKLAERENVNLIDFDDGEWIEKNNKNAKYLNKVHLTEYLDRFDKIIFLPTMRSHRGSRFTMSLKLGMGFVKVKDRLKMHEDKLEEKIAELNLYFKPDLIIMDGRKTFITDGPEKGQIRKPGVLFGSTSRLKIDKEGLKVLKQYKGLTSRLDKPINQLPLIKHAKEIGID